MLQSQVNTSQCISLRVFNPGPGEAAEFPISGSDLHVGPSVPSRRESPMTMTRLFFFLEAVLTQGVDRLPRAAFYTWGRLGRCCSRSCRLPWCKQRAPGGIFGSPIGSPPGLGNPAVHRAGAVLCRSCRHRSCSPR